MKRILLIEAEREQALAQIERLEQEGHLVTWLSPDLLDDDRAEGPLLVDAPYDLILYGGALSPPMPVEPPSHFDLEPQSLPASPSL